MPCADPCRHPHTGPPPLPSAGLCLLPNLALASLQPSWALPGFHTPAASSSLRLCSHCSVPRRNFLPAPHQSQGQLPLQNVFLCPLPCLLPAPTAWSQRPPGTPSSCSVWLGDECATRLLVAGGLDSPSCLQSCHSVLTEHSPQRDSLAIWPRGQGKDGMLGCSMSTRSSGPRRVPLGRARRLGQKPK